MKYKLTKNIHKLPIGTVLYTGDKVTLMPEVLVELELAEEIKDDIDIEAIRKEFHYYTGEGIYRKYGSKKIEFFNALLMVTKVIDQFNGDWKPDWNNNALKYYIYYYSIDKQFHYSSGYEMNQSIIPYCKDKETAQRVIELCGPELKVLFGVK